MSKRSPYFDRVLSIADYTRESDVTEPTYGVCGIVMNCTIDNFENELHFVISQGEDERLYFSTVLGIKLMSVNLFLNSI